MENKKVVLVTIFIIMGIIFTGCLSNPLMILEPKEEIPVDVITEEPVIPQANQIPEIPEQGAVETPKNENMANLYLKNEQGLLIPVVREISQGDKALAKLAFNALVYTNINYDNLKPIGLAPTLPADTKVLGAAIKEDGTIILDLSREITTFSSKEAEELGVKSIVYTMTNFSNIDKVQIRVEGREVEQLVYGTQIGQPIKRSEINLDFQGKTDEKLSKVMVYYQKKVDDKVEYFVPVTKLVSGIENSVEAALISLLEGPSEELNLSTPIPKGTKLLGVQVKDGVAFINLSKEVLAYSGSKATENFIKKSIALTVGEFPEIEKIRIFIEGETTDEVDGLGGNIYLDIPTFVNYYE